MDSSRGKGLRLLSFDGGGIRSLSQLRIMGNLIHRLEFETNSDDSDQEILPCDCVEMMGGSDTGGLIALMLSKLRMSVNDTIKEFHKICCEVYIGDLSPSVRTQKLRECIEDLLRRRNLPIDLKLGKDSRVTDQGCPCFVIATPKISMNSKVKLRTYRSRVEQSLDITLVDAILATCATQPIFLPISIGPELNRQELVGGAMGTANPCRELVLEAQDTFQRTAYISTIISFGSGQPGALSGPTKDKEWTEVISTVMNLYSSYLGVLREATQHKDWMDVLRNMVESCERTAQEIETQIGHLDIYSRFSVEQGLQRLYGAKADVLQCLNTQTAAYLQDVEVSRHLDECVRRLILQQQVITLEQLGLSSAPRVDLQSIQSMNQDLLVSEKLLEELRPKDVKGEPQVEGCLDGTREDILQRIIHWAADLEALNILWLRSHPGAGKTAVALTLVKRLRQLDRLGSRFFFQRAEVADLTPYALWRKVAFDFAHKDPAIRTTLTMKLKADRDIANTNDLADLFHHLIEEPLIGAESMSTEKSLVVIVDALDECGGLDGLHSKGQERLLSTIQQWSTLPRRFKLIVTSRSEDAIERVLQPISHIVEISTGSSIRDKSWDDIKRFLTLRFEEIARPYSSLDPGWPGSEVIEQLADRAGGLFIWARTVVEFIARGPAEQQLSQILKQTNEMGDIAALYSQILSISFPKETEDIIEAFHFTLGAVIFSKTPLSLTSLSSLLSIEHSRVEHICTKLKSVIYIGNMIQVTHQSFVDFLLDPRMCPSAFHIRPEDAERRLAMACLQVMRRNLRFNICGLESSYLLNSKVHDMESRISNNIPNYVVYSCRYWIEHLVANKYEPKVLEHVLHFTESQFLFWLEVLSVTRQMNTASNMLSLLQGWMKDHNQDESMIADMERFTTTFASVIAQSAPHIYLSALPFAPQDSGVSKYYNDRYPGVIRIERGGLEEWPPFESIMYGHKDLVSSISISQDGARIVSGSDDKTVRVWDAATGQPLGAPFEGHTDSVSSVSFSPDGTRIISGSDDETVRVWDAVTGQPLGAPFEGHTDSVSSVIFSPDGTRIASGSDDETVRVWDAATGRPLGAPFEGHTGRVSSVRFSPDGNRIVSASRDKTLQMWDAVTGQPLGASFKGHTDWVTSVAFSPDGTCIVSGSWDKTVRAWDAATGQPLGAPFKGHTHRVTSAAFSPDGTRIVSASWDMTVRVWEVATGQPLGVPFKGHTDCVSSVAFLPDGTYIVSGSWDKTVRAWDSARGQPLGASFDGHTDWVSSVAFSPDGTRIVSGSRDQTVRVWDAVIGRSLGVSFEGHIDQVTSLAFSPDGTRIVSGSDDKTVRVWDAATGHQLRASFKGHTDWISSVAFSPDGARIVSGSRDQTVRVWDTTTGHQLKEPFKGHTDWISSVAFSLDGTRIASGSADKTVRVWDVATGRQLGGLFEGHTDCVSSVAFSPDGTRMASGSADKTVRVWDVVTGQQLGTSFESYTDWISSIAFLPDGTRIVLGSDDRIVQMWDIAIYNIKDLLSFRSGFRISQGWVLNSNFERLFWVPPSLQAVLWLPIRGFILGNLITKVNIERFQYGKSWTNCQRKTLDI